VTQIADIAGLAARDAEAGLATGGVPLCADAHRANERIPADHLATATAMVALAVADLLGTR
jgi:acetylornithine deacetylase/succinyl-diaminopimelate desuccinylase-like protein